MERTGLLRIGELSRRVGVPPELLRAWESRYGLLRPARTVGGFRLYSAEDERRVERMRAYLDEGYSAAEAARLALAADEPPPGRPDGLEAEARVLAQALDGFDDGAANGALDRLLAAFGTETVLAEVVLPYLRDLGERWERGEASIAQEHFASNVVRGRLLGLGRGWGQGTGPRALLACAPGELHDLPLIAFGIALRARGWRVSYLGPDTPLETIADAAKTLAPRLVVVTGSTKERFAAAEEGIRALAAEWPVALAGRGATAEAAERTGARHLPGDPIGEADKVAAGEVGR